LVNGTKRVSRGDAFEHLSRVIGAAVPVLFVATMVPTALLLAAGGWLAGHGIATAAADPSAGGAAVALVALRALVLLVFLLVVIAPLLRAAFSGNQGMVRLLLLPISRRLLHGSELFVGLSDPWLAVIAPALLLLPLGSIFAGLPVVSVLLIGLVLLFLGTLLAAAACSGSLCALLFRDRRRAELATLVVMAVLSVGGLVPAMFPAADSSGPEQETAAQREKAAGAQAEPDAQSSQPTQSTQSTQSTQPVETEKEAVQIDLLDSFLPPFAAFFPPELFSSGVKHLALGDPAAAALRSAGLLVWFAGLYGISWQLFVRRIGQPESQTGRRDVAGGRGLEWVALPGVTPATSAVAWAAARSALRTVRGKIAVGMNFIIVGLTYVVLARQFDAKPFAEMGAAVALTGLAFCLLSLQPVLYNHFAIDRTGLTLQFLSPLTERELVRGKLIGGALLLIPAFGLCLIAALLVAPVGSPWLWLATLPAAVAAYALHGPLGLVLSATFARNARLEQLGSGGNPHSLAGLIATLLAPVVILPSAALGLLGHRVLGNAMWALALVVLWAGLALLMSVPLMAWAENLLEQRRQNLLLVATER
jgi:hypothetical protein